MKTRHSRSVIAGALLTLGVTGGALASDEPGDCEFVIPPGAVTEQDALPGGLPAYLQADMPCEDVLAGMAASGPNAGCSAPAGPQRGFTPLTIGVAMKGDSRASNGARDIDWFALENQLPVQEAFIIDYTFQSTGPMECIPWIANTSLSQCGVAATGSVVLLTDTCQAPRTWRVVLDTLGTGLDGQPNNDLLFRVRNRATTGSDCASGLNDYWLRINWVLPASECPPVPDPPGVVGIDYDDERDEATSTTFDGTGGTSGVQYEPCHDNTPDDGLHRGKGGCNGIPVSDGDFIRLTPGRPMIGVMDYLRTPAVFRDFDWYKFELAERSLVHLRVQCGGPAKFFLTENSCDQFSIIYTTAGTRGDCGGDPMETEGSVVLDPGVYIVYGALGPPEVEPGLSGGSIFGWIHCSPTSTTYGLVKYRLDLTTTPAPPCCAGNADQLSGLVNFDDIVAVLANWEADYGLGATGPGDATCGAGDGVVNFEDINAVLANWLTACP